MQGDSQLAWSSQGEASCSGTPRHIEEEEPGIELATYQQPANLLSHTPPPRLKVWWRSI